MKKWKYEIVVFDKITKTSEPVLNLYGMEGWELVTVIRALYYDLAIFKQEVIQGDKG